MTTAKERMTHRERQRVQDLGTVMDKREGRRFVWGLIQQFNVFSPSFSTDALLMAHQEGVRAAGISLMKDVMSHLPGQYMLMVEEHRPILKELQDAKDEPEFEHDPFSE